uniref:Uncharacterized protein LOC102808557 n=1 Tax=Saccoglossus kowalevskii TaxID=10224 RepID=A0ABM0N125_SACKO|nr:PREDICTED: uncharacterized protein LOC102808557 [Saccoglossus kowalevskii]
MVNRRNNISTSKNRGNKEPPKLQTHHLPSNYVQHINIINNRKNLCVSSPDPTEAESRKDVEKIAIVTRTNSSSTKWSWRMQKEKERTYQQHGLTTKTFDSLPHSWITKTLGMYRIYLTITKFISESMTTWKTTSHLNHAEGSLESRSVNISSVNIKSGIFQGGNQQTSTHS